MIFNLQNHPSRPFVHQFLATGFHIDQVSAAPVAQFPKTLAESPQKSFSHWQSENWQGRSTRSAESEWFSSLGTFGLGCGKNGEFSSKSWPSCRVNKRLKRRERALLGLSDHHIDRAGFSFVAAYFNIGFHFEHFRQSGRPCRRYAVAMKREIRANSEILNFRFVAICSKTLNFEI